MANHFLHILVLMIVILSIPNPSNSGFDNSGNLILPYYYSMNGNSYHKSQVDTSKVPVEIIFPSTIGVIHFPHQVHIEDLGIKCVTCHHQINAKYLSTPHPDYLKSSWIKCEICHKQSEQIAKQVFSCSDCHHSNPKSLTDETLSSKVVIHKKCWECHEVNTGSTASQMCGLCHSGKKS